MINIRNLDFAYQKKQNLFTNLNLNLSVGNIYGLLGKNGAGKSTLLKIITGLVFPQKGQCKVLEFESKNREANFLSEIYFIPEEFFTPSLTIKEYRKLYASFYPRFDSSAFNNYLIEFSLSEKNKLTNLSHGQKKKFFIAFGLAANTRLLIMDEPTNGLDIPSKSQFRKLLISSADENRITLISTHQVRDIQNLIDPILILNEGEIIFQQSMQIINKKLNIQLFPSEPDANTTLFYEKVIGGYAALCDNNQEGASVDLELLFNAVVKNTAKFRSLFNPLNKKIQNQGNN